MMTRTGEISPLVRARVAGILYLSEIPLGLFSLLYVHTRLVVPGDVAATASKIVASESLFRLGIATALIVTLVNMLVALALYQLLKSVNKNMAALMVIFALLGIPIAMLNELNNFAILLVLGDSRLTVFTPDQLHALVALFLNLHSNAGNIANIFWGLWLFPMGYLVFKSGFLPRILGILLMIGCFGYLIQSFTAILLPNLDVNIALLSSSGEILLALWLLIRGVNVERWEQRVRESA